jgi:hypothetical protein
MQYQSPWASIYGSEAKPMPITGPIAGFLPRPIPSASHTIENVRTRTQERRQNLSRIPGPTQSEMTSIQSIGQPQYAPPKQYHEAALCSSNFQNLSVRITQLLKADNVQAAASLVHDCAKERWVFGKNKYDRLNTPHKNVVDLLHQLYSVLTAAGLSLNGGECEYVYRGEHAFILSKNGYRVLITLSGARQLETPQQAQPQQGQAQQRQGPLASIWGSYGGRKRKTRGRKQKKTRKVSKRKN